MGKFFDSQGKRTYIYAKNVGFVEAYQAQNQSSFNSAVNQIIAAHSRINVPSEAERMMSELRLLRKSVRDLHLIIPSSFLELLEISGQLRSLTANSRQAASDGMKVRATFENFFKEMFALKEVEK
jgi:hypothetical protein